jgi:hypothetical protein
VSGDAAAPLRFACSSARERLPAVELSAQSLPDDPKADLELLIAYANWGRGAAPVLRRLARHAVDRAWRAAPTSRGAAVSWNFYWSAGGHAAQPLYNQFDYDGCWVGCGPVAWAMLFGWGDHQAGTGNAYWAPRIGLYRQNGGYGRGRRGAAVPGRGRQEHHPRDPQATSARSALPARGHVPWDMGDAWHYFTGRTGTGLQTHWNSLGIHEDGLRDWAANQIIYRQTPAIHRHGVAEPLSDGVRLCLAASHRSELLPLVVLGRHRSTTGAST